MKIKVFLNSPKFKQYFRWAFLCFSFILMSFLFFALISGAVTALCSVISCLPDITEEEFYLAMGSSCFIGFGVCGLISLISWFHNFPFAYDYDTGRFLKHLLDKIDAIDHEEDPE